MIKNNKIISLLLICILALGVLSGCTNDTKESNPEVSTKKDIEYKEDDKGNISVETGKDFSSLKDEESAAATAKRLEELVKENVDNVTIVDVRPIFIEDGYYPHVSMTNPNPQTNEEIKGYFLDIIDDVKEDRENYPSEVFSLMWVTNDTHNEVYRQDFRVN